MYSDKYIPLRMKNKPRKCHQQKIARLRQNANSPLCRQYILWNNNSAKVAQPGWSRHFKIAIGGLRSRSKIKFTFPVSFGCFSPILKGAYAHTRLTEWGKSNSK
jgi:hypothetical protein